MNPEIIHNMPDAEYRAAQAIAGSDAKQILHPKTPAHYAAHMGGELKREQTRSMLIGTLCHLAVLEPHKLDGAFTEKPEGLDYRTKEGKEFKAAAGSKPILDAAEVRAVRGIRDSIAAHAGACDLLRETDSEVSMFATDPETGLRIKGRLDALRVLNDMEAHIVDVKTTSAGADAHNFARQAASLNYHFSAAWYLRLCELNGLPPTRFYWLAVETAPPYAVALYEVHPDALELGRDMMREALDLIADCEAAGEWPAYGDGVATLNLPPWTYKNFAQ
jgi:hypothetical protein